VSENSLKALPASIGGLTSLTSLNVSKNILKELPPTLGKLAGLVQLIACNNRITNVPEYDPVLSLSLCVFTVSLTRHAIPRHAHTVN
jgi:Leucine-rich repeat (LRR) protein